MKKTLIALAVAAMATTANAAVLIDAPSEQPQVKHHVAKTDMRTQNSVKKVDIKQEVSTFDHVGNKQHSEKLEGFSSDVTIREAIEQIVPEGWDIRVNNKVNIAKKVSFAGGKTWNDTLEVIGKDNFSAIFDWNRQVLTINPTSTNFKTEVVATTEDFGAARLGAKPQVGEKPQAPRKPVQPKVVKKAPAKQANPAPVVAKAVVAKPAPVVAKTPVVAKNPVVATAPKATKEAKVETWLLDSRYTLEKNITNWAERAGWRVVWKAPDYNVVANATFKGAIDSEDGPIISIMKLYQDSNLPLRVNILGGNKVIFVEARNYVNTDVIDITAPVK